MTPGALAAGACLALALSPSVAPAGTLAERLGTPWAELEEMIGRGATLQETVLAALIGRWSSRTATAVYADVQAGKSGWSRLLATVEKIPKQIEVEVPKALLTTTTGPAVPTPSAAAGLSAVPPVTVQTWTDPTTGMVFVWVPGGCFQMGSSAAESGHSVDEDPRHEVCVDGFWMGRTEVTNAQYRRYKPDHDSLSYHGNSFNGDDQPVVRVNWVSVQEYVRWLSGETGKQFRLPTEAEWEYAARGGTTTARYWGVEKSNACRHANVFDRGSSRVNTNFTWENHDCDDGSVVTAPVGSFRANGFGLYDMLGNVWEWCSDWYGEKYYGERARNNPTGPPSGVYRIFRGGSWDIEPKIVRSAARSGDVPERRSTSVGFRLVLSGSQR